MTQKNHTADFATISKKDKFAHVYSQWTRTNTENVLGIFQITQIKYFLAVPHFLFD